VDVDPVTNLVFVASTQQEEVQVLSGSTYAVTATVPGISGNYLAVNPVTKKVYVTGIDGVTVMTEQ
jgi:DNA-binding beta-propeller fold protein YncE